MHTTIFTAPSLKLFYLPWYVGVRFEKGRHTFLLILRPETQSAIRNRRKVGGKASARRIGPDLSLGPLAHRAALVRCPRERLKMLTARAMTNPRMTSDATAWLAMASLAQRARGITSVGLKAVESVNAR